MGHCALGSWDRNLCDATLHLETWGVWACINFRCFIFSVQIRNHCSALKNNINGSPVPLGLWREIFNWTEMWIHVSQFEVKSILKCTKDSWVCTFPQKDWFCPSTHFWWFSPTSVPDRENITGDTKGNSLSRGTLSLGSEFGVFYLRMQST